MIPREEAVHALVCRTGKRWCALPLANVLETMRPLPVEPLAGMPAFVRGLSILRGAPTPVVDAAGLLGGRAETVERFVLLRAGERCVALAVGSASRIREISPSDLADCPPLLSEANAAAVEAVGRLDAELLLVLDTARIVPDSVWEVL